MKNLAIVGLGYWGQNLVGALNASSDMARFTLGVTRRPDAIRALSSRWNMRVVESYEEALASKEVDGIVLASPDRLHAEQVIAAAAAKKPVLVEKPFTLDRVSANRAIAAAKQHGTLVAFAHNRRFLPAVAEISEWIQSGCLGDLLHIEGNFSSNYGYRLKEGMWRANPDETVAGGMTGMGIHHLDLMILFGGKIDKIQAKGRRQSLNIPVEDNVTFLADFTSGATGAFTTLITTSPIWRLRVLGSKGWLEMIGENRLLSCEGMGPVRETTYPIVSTERSELHAFVEAMDGSKPYPVSVEDALHGVSALETIVRSIREQGEVLAVEP